MRDELVARRRDFHEHPELAFQEVRTAGIVANELGALGLEVQTGIGKTGVIGILDGEHDGPTIMVRCDMDALPVQEANDVEYISQTHGKMHACGHDGHTAIGLAVAKMLVAHRDQIAGRVKFVFQPAEETGEGAYAMIRDGALLDPAPQVSVGLHLWNNLPVGEVGLTSGPIMSSCDVWKIIVRGAGGHGALPEQTHDPIIAGAAIISALQTIVSRNVSALDTAVITAGMFHGGEARNVIPSSAQITGDFRAFTPHTRDLVARRLREVATGVATALQCEADVIFEALTLPVINDPEVTARLQRALGKINSPRPLQIYDNVRWMAAEDMAAFLEKVPGTFILVGSANHERHLDYPHHHPRFDFDEDALPIGAGLLAASVAEYIFPA
jgi:amidohydrolase